ncbi:MAG: hypothetical protein IKK97_04115 [Phascolarctobacterium sp.]|nr:hypothetical protein [Phascolarctobacterium sp.]
MATGKLELVVVDIQHAKPNLYCFADSMEEAEEKKAQAYVQRRKDALRYSLLFETHPTNQNYKLYWEEARNAKFEVMTFAEYQARQRQYFVNRPIEEVSAESFNNAFECLPPLHIRHLSDKDWYFSMSEFYTGTFTGQYAYINGKYYYALVDITDNSTYIHNRLEGQAQ